MDEEKTVAEKQDEYPLTLNDLKVLCYSAIDSFMTREREESIPLCFLFHHITTSFSYLTVKEVNGVFYDAALRYAATNPHGYQICMILAELKHWVGINLYEAEREREEYQEKKQAEKEKDKDEWVLEY